MARAGMFVSGYFALGLLDWVFWSLVGPLMSSPAARLTWLVVAAAAGAMTAALLMTAGRLRNGKAEPFGVMAAFGAAQYVVLTAATVGYAAGAEGEALFWLVLAFGMPAVLSVLLWLPHPVLGVSVGAGVVAAVLAVPLDANVGAEVAARALLVGVCALGLAMVVELRTGTRAGSFLHYLGVVAFAVGTVAALTQLDAAPGVGAAAGIGMAELLIALLMRRRSWAYVAWLTLEVSLVELLRWALPSVGLDAHAFDLAAPALVVGAVMLHRCEEPLRRRLLEGMAPTLANLFPR